MKWSEISILITAEAVEAVSNILYEAGASGVVIEDPEMLSREWEDRFGEIYALNPDDFPAEGVVVKAYLPVNETIEETTKGIQQAVNGLQQFGLSVGTGLVTVTEVDEDDWAHAWKKYYKPIRITDRITISPTWEEYRPQQESELVIELDPGMAFGTGTHPTTILCIRALEMYVKPGDYVIDVGCGSGILSVAAAVLGAKSVLALDLDELAVKTTIENAEVNRVSGTITARPNNLLEEITEPADVIVANILAEIIVRFVDDAYKTVKAGGYFITSGIILQKAADVETALKQAGFTIVDIFEQDDWVSIIAQKAE